MIFAELHICFPHLKGWKMSIGKDSSICLECRRLLLICCEVLRRFLSGTNRYKPRNQSNGTMEPLKNPIHDFGEHLAVYQRVLLSGSCACSAHNCTQSVRIKLCEHHYCVSCINSCENWHECSVGHDWQREGLGIGILCTQCVHSCSKSEQQALRALLHFCPVVCGFEELRGANACFSLFPARLDENPI